MTASPTDDLAPLNERTARLAALARGGAMATMAAVLLYRPVFSGVPHRLAPSAVFGLLLLVAGVLWLYAEVLHGRLDLRFGVAGGIFAAFMLVGAVAGLAAPQTNLLAAAQWWWTMATYGLTALIVLQLASAPEPRRFLLACILATAAALTCYALWHRVFTVPALSQWYARNPAAFLRELGVDAHLLGDVRGRLGAGQAYGSFVTANQLAAFLVLTVPPLAALAVDGTRRRAHRCLLAGAALAGVLALLLTGSKGGWLALAAASALPAVIFLKAKRKRYLLASAAVLLLGMTFILTWSPARQAVARSAGVRLGYWRTSASMIRSHPLLGVGPGSWGDYYRRGKAPEDEEARAAHNAHLQVAAETGLPSLALWLTLWGLVLWRCRPGGSRKVGKSEGRKVDGRGNDELQTTDDAQHEGRGRTLITHHSSLITTGLVVSALAWLCHFYIVGGFHPPPEGGPAWLRSASALPYLLTWAVWAGVFLTVLRSRGNATALRWGLLVGVVGFLLHSAVDFTFRVPALGGTAAALAAIAVAGAHPPRRIRIALGPLRAGLLLLSATTVALVWCWFVAPLTIEHSDAVAEATQNPTDAAWEHACLTLPLDDEAWAGRATFLLDQPERYKDAVASAEMAIRLHPLSASNWKLLGDVHRAAGKHTDATKAYALALDLYPSLPLAWYVWARSAEISGVALTHVSAGHARGLALLERQHHRRNRILGPPTELSIFAEFGADELTPAILLQGTLEMARRLGRYAAPDGAAPADVLEALAAHVDWGEHPPPWQRIRAEWRSMSEAERLRRLWAALAEHLWRWELEFRSEYASRSV
jgi:O-Antigen ligase